MIIFFRFFHCCFILISTEKKTKRKTRNETHTFEVQTNRENSQCLVLPLQLALLMLDSEPRLYAALYHFAHRKHDCDFSEAILFDFYFSLFLHTRANTHTRAIEKHARIQLFAISANALRQLFYILWLILQL